MNIYLTDFELKFFIYFVTLFFSFVLYKLIVYLVIFLSVWYRD